MTRYIVHEVLNEEAEARKERGLPVGDDGDFTYEVKDIEGRIVYVAYSPTEAFQWLDETEGRIPIDDTEEGTA